MNCLSKVSSFRCLTECLVQQSESIEVAFDME